MNGVDGDSCSGASPRLALFSACCLAGRARLECRPQDPLAFFERFDSHRTRTVASGAGVQRPVSTEIRLFRVARLAEPEADASHLRQECASGHPVTMGNTVPVGKAGYRCRQCRRELAYRSLQRKRSSIDGTGP
jgi:hypothetical protein